MSLPLKTVTPDQDHSFLLHALERHEPIGRQQAGLAQRTPTIPLHADPYFPPHTQISLSMSSSRRLLLSTRLPLCPV